MAVTFIFASQIETDSGLGIGKMKGGFSGMRKGKGGEGYIFIPDKFVEQGSITIDVMLLVIEFRTEIK